MGTAVADLAGGVSDPAFAAAFLNLCSSLGVEPSLPLILCGSGVAAPQLVPARPDGLLPVVLSFGQGTADSGLGASGHAVPGLAQTSPPAVMQGAETCIRGFLSQNPGWDGVLCLPGETTHWVLISAEEVVSFQSFSTAVLASAGLASAGLTSQAWGAGALAKTCADTLSRPELASARLAQAKAALILGQSTKAEAAGQIWGAFLGAELAAARPYWLGQNIALIGEDEISSAYSEVLRDQGLPVEMVQAEPMILAGLIETWRQLQP